MTKKKLKFSKIGDKATLKSWLKEVGDRVDIDEPLIEIFTDQGDSVITSKFSGKLSEKRFKIGDIIDPGEVIALIEEEDDDDDDDIEEGENNLDSNLNNNSENLIEVGSKSVFKSGMLYFIAGVMIIASVTWFVLKPNEDAVIDLKEELNIQEKEVEIAPIPEKIKTPPVPEIIETEEKKSPIPEKIKTSPDPKVNEKQENNIKEDCEEKEIDDIVVSFADVDNVPVFPGCKRVMKPERRNCFQEQMNKHIKRTFRYPEIAQEMGIQGRVYVNFIISACGTIENIRLRGPDKHLEKEAQRIISLLPRLLPGTLEDGTPVNVPFSLPITFRLR